MWDIIIPKKILKNIEKYPNIQPVYQQFLKDLTTHGPYLVWYPNYGKLKGGWAYHCHLSKGNPTFVAVWEIKDKKIKLIEVTYVGTHENAPY